MNTRVLIAGLAAGVAGFLLGWLLFGMLLMGYFEANIFQYEGMNKPEESMNLLLVLLGNLAWGLMLAWVCARTAAQGAMAGMVTGAVLGLGVYTSFALMFYAFMNWYMGPAVAVVDVLANTVWTAAMGLVAGALLARGKG